MIKALNDYIVKMYARVANSTVLLVLIRPEIDPDVKFLLFLVFKLCPMLRIFSLKGVYNSIEKKKKKMI